MGQIRQWYRNARIARFIAALYRTKALKFVIPAAVIAFVYWQGQKEFRRIDWGGTFHYLRQLKPATLAMLLLCSLAAVAVISGYDFLIRRHFRLPVGLWATFRYAWIANTTNSVIGFAGIAGAALRTVLYRSRGIPMATIASSIAFLSTITITGLSLLSWAGILGILPMHDVIRTHPWTLYIVWADALFLPIFILLQRTRLFAKWFNRNRGPIDWGTIASSVGVSVLEWSFAGVAFWLIASRLLPGLTIAQALGIFTISAVTGLVSMAPGGIGGFDLTALLGLGMLGYPPERTAAVLVLFRLLYYIVPWLIGLVMAAFEFTVIRRKREETDNLPGRQDMEPALNFWQRIWLWPGQSDVASGLGAWALGKLVFAAGFMLLLSAATPGLLDRLRFANELFSFPLMRLSRQLSVMIGFMLIVLSWGISHRVKRAFRWTMGLLCAGAVFTFTKAFDFEEALFLFVIALLLWVSRSRFYRKASPFSTEQAVIWALVTLILALLYNFMASGIQPGFVKLLPPDSALVRLMDPSANMVTAFAALIIAWLMITFALLLRPTRTIGNAASPEELRQAARFLKRYHGTLLSRMLYSGDKSFFWANEGRVLIVYAKSGNRLVVLGDPVGERESIGDAIREFLRFADEYALTVAFYQITPEYLPIYHENGFRLFKLGEEAVIPLDRFTLSGEHNGDLSHAGSGLIREGYAFEVAQPPHDPELLKRLELISDTWLRGKKQKRLSPGWFDPAALQQAPVALLYNARKEVEAFASFAPGNDDGDTLSVDLMRFLPEAPNGTIDELIASLMRWAKENGYARFNFGMAPPAAAGDGRNAMPEEKFARYIYEYGGFRDRPEGLRKYKQNFSPDWQPRFLAYQETVSLPLLLMEINRLILRRPSSHQHSMHSRKNRLKK